jgi:protein-S-isoprenylcysteine O-methyltransferase Ste14
MPLLPATLSPWLGAILIVGGIAIVVSAIRAFRQARTPVDVRKPTTAIVTHGVFQWSRNPMYLSLTLLYLGLALLLNSLWIVLMAVPVLGVVRWGVIAREELYLERKFGEEYLRYKAKVRRWL